MVSQWCVLYMTFGRIQHTHPWDSATNGWKKTSDHVEIQTAVKFLLSLRLNLLFLVSLECDLCIHDTKHGFFLPLSTYTTLNANVRPEREPDLIPCEPTMGLIPDHDACLTPRSHPSMIFRQFSS